MNVMIAGFGRAPGFRNSDSRFGVDRFKEANPVLVADTRECKRWPGCESPSSDWLPTNKGLIMCAWDSAAVGLWKRVDQSRFIRERLNSLERGRGFYGKGTLGRIGDANAISTMRNHYPCRRTPCHFTARGYEAGPAIRVSNAV